jgi:hypothetical protein
MDRDLEMDKVKQDIAKGWESYENMLQTDKPLEDITPVNIDIVPLIPPDAIPAEKKNRQE